MPGAVSVVVPTYKEVGNLPELISRLRKVRDEHSLDLELVIADDDSRDGTAELVAKLNEPWVTLLTRTKDRGLSAAVLDGIRTGKHDRFVVMDADLSHPPEKVPELLSELDRGADFVIGSRYVKGASTDEDWGFLRAVNSRVATWMARPFTAAKDPMSGFFALTRQRFEAGRYLNPIGYKIGLELIVKCDCRRIAEVPIHFADRTVGESKLTLAEQLRYIQHVRRLFIHRHPGLSYLFQFGVVGATGTLVNLSVLTLLVAFGASEAVAVAAAIFVSLFTNFLLNRRFTFGYARTSSFWMQFVAFAAACALGALANYGVTMWLLHSFSTLPLQLSAMLGILAGMGLNFLTSRYLVFRKKRASASPENDAKTVTSVRV
jgi:dolichol-phosphate mannosyltransferase